MPSGSNVHSLQQKKLIEAHDVDLYGAMDNGNLTPDLLGIEADDPLFATPSAVLSSLLNQTDNVPNPLPNLDYVEQQCLELVELMSQIWSESFEIDEDPNVSMLCHDAILETFDCIDHRRQSFGIPTSPVIECYRLATIRQPTPRILKSFALSLNKLEDASFAENCLIAHAARTGRNRLLFDSSECDMQETAIEESGLSPRTQRIYSHRLLPTARRLYKELHHNKLQP